MLLNNPSFLSRLPLLLAGFAGLASAQTGYWDGALNTEGGINSCVDAGAVNAYSCSNPAGATLAAYRSGQGWTVKIANTNTGASTLQIDGLGAVPIKRLSGGVWVNLSAGQLVAGSEPTLVYDGSIFELLTALDPIPTQAQINTALYDDPQLANWSTAFHNAGNQIAKVAVLGDSISRDNQLMFAGVGPANPANLWPRALAAALQTKGNRGVGVIPILGDANGPHTDERITLSSTGWTTTTVMGPRQTGTFAYNSLYQGAAGATLDLTSQYADNFNFYCVIRADSGNGFQVSIDGGASTTICNTTGALAAVIQSVSAGSLGNHTVHMTVPAGAGFGYLYAIAPTIGSTGVQVDNYAIGAARTESWGQPGTQRLAFLDASHAISPYNLVIISLRTNDEIHATGNTSAQYQSFLSTTVAHLNALPNPPSILILDEPHIDLTTYPSWNGEPESNYQAAEQAVVNAGPANTVYLSVADRWTSAANAQALFLVGADKLHPIDKGALDIANLVAHRVMDVAGGGGSSSSSSGGITSISPLVLGSDYAGVNASVAASVGSFRTANETGSAIYRWGTGGSTGVLQLPGNANFLYHENTGFSPLTNLVNDHVIFGGNLFATGGLTDDGNALQFHGGESHAGAMHVNGSLSVLGTSSRVVVGDAAGFVNGGLDLFLGGVAGSHELNLYTHGDGQVGLYDDTGGTSLLAYDTASKKLAIDPPLQLAQRGAQPACSLTYRGSFWFLNNGAAKDNLQVCVYDGSAYNWINLY